MSKILKTCGNVHLGTMRHIKMIKILMNCGNLTDLLELTKTSNVYQRCHMSVTKGLMINIVLGQSPKQQHINNSKINHFLMAEVLPLNVS
ncbi:hypothetical protein PoB_002008700 [Plakobranchus ocellatus]|uniref:Uncharacterized protein n=1 Tax=Plakobranchus ocellatus TaxID=259542 RepID=A0AAV3ZGH3_9GAST|nr:hypothetical protein PoB_002008700 [Plakobranchus ocellatus]